jgi:hypothetical protein
MLNGSGMQSFIETLKCSMHTNCTNHQEQERHAKLEHAVRERKEKKKKTSEDQQGEQLLIYYFFSFPFSLIQVTSGRPLHIAANIAAGMKISDDAVGW